MEINSLNYLFEVVENETGSSPKTARLLLSLATSKEINLKLSSLVVDDEIFSSFVELVKAMRSDAGVHYWVMDEIKKRKAMLEEVADLEGL